MAVGRVGSGGRLEWTSAPFPALLATLAAAAVSTFLLPIGFQGWDDLQYVQAAERWLAEGVHAGDTHWANRLPFVLLIAASLRLFGESAAAPVPMHLLLQCAALLLIWKIAKRAFDEWTALWSVLAALCTPLILCFSTTFYPEVLEAVLTGVSVAGVLAVIDRPAGAPTRMALLLAGLAGGLALVVRQTAIATPVALGLLLLALPRGRVWPSRFADLACLALGFAVPVAGDMLFYGLLTGDPLHRLAVDQRSVLIPSTALPGNGIYAGGSPLFNLELAARWRLPVLVDLHWTVNGLIRVSLTRPCCLRRPSPPSAVRWPGVRAGWGDATPGSCWCFC